MNFIRGCIESDGCYFVNRTGHVQLSLVQLPQTVPTTSLTCSPKHASESGFEYRRYRYRLNDIRINRRDSGPYSYARSARKGESQALP